MKFIMSAVLALVLTSGIAQAQYYNPYSESSEAQEMREAAAERKLRIQLMEEQREALRDQKRMMRSQEIRNDLQTLEMLGPRGGGVPQMPGIQPIGGGY